MTLVSQLEKAGEGSLFTVHPGQTSSRAKTTWWVRDSRCPHWPEGPYATRDEAHIAALARNYQEKNNVG